MTREEATKDQCTITRFTSFSCYCRRCYGNGRQYMYHAIATNETCGNQTIKSIKDDCEHKAYKPIYLIGSTRDCYIYDCDGFFTFDSPEYLDYQSDTYITIGITLLTIAGLCCFCLAIAGCCLLD